MHNLSITFKSMSSIWFLFFSILINFIICNNDVNIITILDYPKKTQYIPTRLGPIIFQFYFDYEGYCFIDNLTNLNLFTFPNYNCTYEIYGKNNDSLKIKFEYDSVAIFNKLICRLFYETKYIDKMIYAIGFDEHYYQDLKKKNYYQSRFYGGLPKDISYNLIKYSFLPNDKVSEISILYNNGTKVNIQTDSDKKENNLIGFGGGYICFPEYILIQMKNLLLKDFRIDESWKEISPKYLINSEQFKNFPDNISFTIEDKLITINKYDLSPIFKDFPKNFLSDFLIQYTPCNHFILGNIPFLINIDVREYNLETNETNFYVRKNNSIIMGIKEEKINSYKFNYLILVFVVFSSINFFIFWRKKERRKKIEEFNKYYIV